MMKISIVLTTCNRAEFLRLCLCALARQTFKEFEVVIADDGSTDHTPEVIEEAKGASPFPIAHVWQPRDGHSRTKMLNEGIKAAQCDYIFFTDCDVLARANVLEAHLSNFSSDCFLLGSMVRMSKEQTNMLTLEDIMAGAFERKLTPDIIAKLRRDNRTARIRTFLRMRREPHIYGTNFSVAKDALIKVNGYDENFRGWGNADGDLRERLKMIGLRPKPIYDKAIVLHMYHPRDPTAALRLNRAYARRRNIPARCLNGIVKLQESEQCR